MGTIPRRDEAPLKGIIEVELFDVWGSTSWDHSHLPTTIITFY